VEIKSRSVKTDGRRLDQSYRNGGKQEVGVSLISKFMLLKDEEGNVLAKGNNFVVTGGTNIQVFLYNFIYILRNFTYVWIYFLCPRLYKYW